ncbi:DUF4407 domain-containing protein [Bradyrhizobium acaciae]|uniref:DUF4407 domain-containing protein n=1 Tax=Bradyrhizobium acaciae TaxID=2683706 RepID=UPI001E46097F|nr:DUF4407 domain-containing protein [Bradyrhizobium acaciae]MCC8978882.1 DUF4407 domain-containing protein [Bradyrhizobium acaciae]
MAEKETNSAAREGRALSLVTRILIAPTLVHHDIVRACPDGDLRVLRVLGLLIYVSAAWQAALWSNAAAMMLSTSVWHPAAIAIGVLVAGIVGLIDVLVFIAASWNAQGQAEVERTYLFKLPRKLSDTIKKFAFSGGRFLMVLMIGTAMATVAGTIAFKPEIDQLLAARYLERNRPLIKEKAAGVDAELVKNKASQSRVTALLPSIEEEERTLRAFNLDPKVDEVLLRSANQRATAAQNARAAAERELKAARAVLARAGDRPNRRAAQERLSSAEREFAAAARGSEEAQQRVLEQTEARGKETQRKEALAADRLREVTDHRRELEQQLAELRVVYDRTIASREATVRQLAQQDPRHVARDDGLLARLKALHELSRDEVVARTLFIFEAILILLELAAVLGKTITLIPMTYATRLFEADLVRAVETAGRTKKAIEGPSPVPEAPPIAPAPEPPRTPSVVTVPAAPVGKPETSAPDKPPRHAPRWKPSLQAGHNEPPREH